MPKTPDKEWTHVAVVPVHEAERIPIPVTQVPNGSSI